MPKAGKKAKKAGKKAKALEPVAEPVITPETAPPVGEKSLVADVFGKLKKGLPKKEEKPQEKKVEGEEKKGVKGLLEGFKLPPLPLGKKEEGEEKSALAEEEEKVIEFEDDELRADNIIQEKKKSTLDSWLGKLKTTMPKKKIVEAEDLLPYLIRPNSIITQIDSIKVNDLHNQVMMAVGYPRKVPLGFLDKIIKLQGNFDLSMYVEPFPIEIMIVKLQKELEKQAADLQADTIKGKINPSLENQIKDTREALDNLMLGHERMFNVALYMNAKANQEHDLVRLSKKLESELNSINIIPKKPSFRMAEGLQSMLPLCQDKLKVTRNVSTSALSAFFPFTTSFLELRESGVMMGVNKDNNIPIIMDIFQKPFSNPNGLVLSTSGAGKSYLIKLFILRQLLRGVKVIVVDPQKEYLKIAEAAEGEIITISKDSPSIINPFDLMEQDMNEKLLSLESLFEVMLQPTDVQKGILSKAVKETYAQKGIKAFDPKTWKKEPPTLGDFYKVIMKMRNKAEKSVRDQFEALVFKLYRYVDGPFSFLNKRTNISFNKDLIVFNIRDMPDAVQPVVMFLIMEYVYKKMMRDKEKKLLVIDEAWSLLSHTSESNYIFKIVKTCRKFNLGLTLITQEVKDLVGAKAGEAVLANTSYTYLLRQKPTVIDAVTDFFKLNPTERNILVTAKVGEGLLLAENDHIPIKIVASKKEHAMLVS